jgi:pSer/pThr/pTyr-binding forkhead associated (FHA) protein
MPTLTLKFKNEPIALFNLEEGRSLKIGRKIDNDVIINNLAVSGYHAKIDPVGDTFVFVDLQSKNGSFVNEKLVNSHWLQDGDVISVGKHALVFSYSNEESRPDYRPSEMDKTMLMDTNHYRAMMEKSIPEIPTAPSPPSAPEKSEKADRTEIRKTGYLNYLNGGRGHVRLRSQQTKIGKDSASDILIKGMTIGKLAATITRTHDGYVLQYVEGFAKPKVNDQKVADERIILQESDIIKIGSTKFQFVIKAVRKKSH